MSTHPVVRESERSVQMARPERISQERAAARREGGLGVGVPQMDLLERYATGLAIGPSR